MIELGIGILFSLLFVTVYLLVSHLRRQRREARATLPRNISPSAKELRAKRDNRALTAAELSKHYLPEAKSSSSTSKNS